MDGQFSRCLRLTLAWEGGWSDHAQDPGGATQYGITIARYRAYKGRTVTKDELRNISMVEVEDIYRTGYWRPVWGDKLPRGLDLVLFDYGVNSGPSRAVKEIQRIVGVQPDGVMGAFTLEAIKKRGTIDIIHAVCDARLRFLKSLRTWGVFGKGWNRRVQEVRAKAVAMATSDRAPVPSNAEPTPRAREADVRPMAKPNAKEKATATAASVGAAITEATQTLAPHSDSLAVIKWLCIALAVASAGLLLWRAFKDQPA